MVPYVLLAAALMFFKRFTVTQALFASLATGAANEVVFDTTSDTACFVAFVVIAFWPKTRKRRAREW